MAGKSVFSQSTASLSKLPSAKRITIGDGIVVSVKQHDELVEMLINKVKGFNVYRGPMVERFRQIDKELSGHIIPNLEDMGRIRDNRRGKGPKTVDENIQFALMQLDECVTFMMGVYAPDGGMYSAITSKDKQPVANGISVLMNRHSRVFKHYRNTAKALLDMFKYNLGGWEEEWWVQRGQKIKGSVGGAPNVLLDEIILQGNKLRAYDPYNFIYDPAVCPVDIGMEAEFAGEVDLIRPYKVETLEEAGYFYSVKDRVDFTYGQVRFFEPKPIIQHQYIAGGAPITNWDQLFSQKYGGTDDNDKSFESQSVERLWLYIRLNPSKWGLSKNNQREIWRFHLMNNTWIVRAERMVNVHGRIPYNSGMPNEDGMGLQSRTFAEMLLPFQRFASSQINVHQRAARKRLFGLTIYNRNIIPLLENEDLGGGKVPANPMVADFDLNKAILQFNDAPDTSESMKDVENALQLMQRILPTTQAQQVASLERATRYQAAAFVQASNKRNLKLAKLLDDQAMDTSRRMQVTNIMQFQDSIEVIDPTTGDQVKLNPADFRDVDIEFAIADGLRGLDKLMIIESLQEVMNMLLQSQVARDYDIGALIGYFMELQGEKWDFSQFKYKTPMDALPPELKNAAFALLQNTAEGAAALQAAQQSGQGGGTPGLTPMPGGPQLGLPKPPGT